MRGVEAGERHGEVEPQAEVGKVEGLGGRTEIVGGQPALEHPEGELLVVAAEPGVQARAVLHDRGLDLVEPVGRVGVADDAEHTLATGLLCGEEVTHAAGRVDGGSHATILAGRARGGGWPRDRPRARAVRQGAPCRLFVSFADAAAIPGHPL